MAEVKKRKGENFDSLMRRFRRSIQRSGRLLQAKKVRFRSDTPNKTARKRSALHRIAASEEHAYLEKIGKLPKDERRTH